MSAKPGNVLVQRRLATAQAGGITLLDAVERVGDDGLRQITMFFESGVDPAQITFGNGWRLADTGSIGGAPWLSLEGAPGAVFDVQFAGEPVPISPALAELEMLEGANAALSVRNGESAETVLAWLEYHCTRHGMTAAVILNRAKPGTDKGFAEALERGLEQAGFDCRLVLLEADVPMGRPDLPPEAHPYCVPGAPGKDRMNIPPSAPWTSPLRIAAVLRDRQNPAVGRRARSGKYRRV